MHRFCIHIGLALLFSIASCDGIPEPPNPPRLVNDFAGIFTQPQIDSLESVLVSFDANTSNQICFVSVKTLKEQEVDEFALKLANKWGIGTEKHQNGVLLLIKPRGRDNDYIDVTIQVGRGLEGAIPDIYASRIIRHIMGPYLKRDDYWAATVKCCEELMALASGEISEPRIDRGLKQGLVTLKQNAKSGFNKFLRELFKGFLGLLGIGLFFGIIFLIEKKNDKKKVKVTSSKPQNDSCSPPVIDPGIIDSTPSQNNHTTTNDNGFGGFGGGSFGGGGASGRF